MLSWFLIKDEELVGASNEAPSRDEARTGAEIGPRLAGEAGDEQSRVVGQGGIPPEGEGSTMVTASTRRYVSSREELRDIITAPEPDGLVIRKQLPALDHHARQFIALSPFVLLATSSATGRCDVTPRGDGPGFVAVLDANTLVIPERPGNRRIDSLQNIIENPHVGLLFMIPGVDETLRVNGAARVLDDPELLGTMAVQGKTPRLGVEVEVQEVFFHCARAFKRSKLWVTETWGERSALPSLAQIFADQMQGPGLDCETLEARLAHSSANLY